MTQSVCPHCQGTGECQACLGKGKVLLPDPGNDPAVTPILGPCPACDGSGDCPHCTKP